ncbi:hypothetical protein LCGC14_1228010 [marine sediment metagenome]|uniref:Uncharacterized protein n=1 Tax=marine sediment metagenome TaxID=412755 RepID=A0A0F9PDR6_9ZZZZ
MAYCNHMKTQNCLECAIEAQTKSVVMAIKSLKNESETSVWQKIKRYFKKHLLRR